MHVAVRAVSVCVRQCLSTAYKAVVELFVRDYLVRRDRQRQLKKWQKQFGRQQMDRWKDRVSDDGGGVWGMGRGVGAWVVGHGVCCRVKSGSFPGLINPIYYILRLTNKTSALS